MWVNESQQQQCVCVCVCMCVCVCVCALSCWSDLDLVSVDSDLDWGVFAGISDASVISGTMTAVKVMQNQKTDHVSHHEVCEICWIWFIMRSILRTGVSLHTDPDLWRKESLFNSWHRLCQPVLEELGSSSSRDGLFECDAGWRGRGRLQLWPSQASSLLQSTDTIWRWRSDSC